VKACTPTGAGIVDENVELLLPFFDLAGEAIDLLHPPKIGRNGNAFTDPRQFLGQLLARLGAACCDVNLHAIFDLGPGDHLAEPATAAGDDGDLAAQRRALRFSFWSPDHREAETGIG